jgi:capsid protein
MPGALLSRTLDTPDGARTFQSQEVWAGGQIPKLNPGEKLELLTDQRPHPNVMEFQDELYRDIASGYGTDLEAIYKLGKMTGPGVRFMMDKLSRWIGDEQDALREWAIPVCLYFLAWDLTHGLLDFPADGGDWMALELMPQRDLTIDRSKEGSQRMAELDRGMGTLARWHAAISGSDWEDELDQRIEEVRTAKEKCEEAGLDYYMVFPPAVGAMIPPGLATDATVPLTDDGDDDEGEDPNNADDL